MVARATIPSAKIPKFGVAQVRHFGTQSPQPGPQTIGFKYLSHLLQTGGFL